MLAKGLDLPASAWVGVLVTDTSLQLPDYTAAEHHLPAAAGSWSR